MVVCNITMDKDFMKVRNVKKIIVYIILQPLIKMILSPETIHVWHMKIISPTSEILYADRHGFLGGFTDLF